MINRDQIKATDPEYSVWLNAGAGTGKTKVLVDRVLRIIIKGVEWHKILCLTFTNATANEMTERILLQIEKWYNFNESELILNLTNLLGTAPSQKEVNIGKQLFLKYTKEGNLLKIHTIHSFCQYALRTFSMEAGVSSYFEVIDSWKQKSILKDLKTNLFLNLNSITNDIYNSDSNVESDHFKFFLNNLHDLRIQELLNDIIGNRAKFLALFRQYASPEIYEEYLTNIFKVDRSFSIDQKISNVLASLSIIQSKPITVTDEKFINAYNDFAKSDSETRLKKFDVFKDIFIKTNGEPRQKLLSQKFSQEDVELYNHIIEIQNLILELENYQKSINLIRSS